MRCYTPLLIVLLCILTAGKLHASHYYGIDLYYTHITGNTYRVSLVAFGDCSGAQFPTFSTARPLIYIKRGATTVLQDFLNLEPPTAGVEVTAGCPADMKRTNCVDPSSPVPGVKKFVYSKNFTLPATAPDWKFVYLGETDGAPLAGRSNGITNVSPPGIISLEATLDNTTQQNSSLQFNSIATQFYCVNVPAEYMANATDADGDSLVFELVPGLDAGVPVNYLPGFTPTNPMSVAAGTFKFSSITGQLGFTPNVLQKSLVAYRVSEYRNGVLIGTVMREMTIVVLPCPNKAPEGYITNADGAEIIDPLTVQTCIGKHEVSFDINPTDSEKHSINMVPGTLPEGATLNVTNNNTTEPKGRFVWNMPDLPYKDYKFDVTYTDDGCPPKSLTQTYTIRIQPDTAYASVEPATCEDPGRISITPPAKWMPWNFKLVKGDTLIYSGQNISTPVWHNVLAKGKYTMQATNEIGCYSDVDVKIPSTCYVADIPNAFSPNGDGRNDVLYVRGENIDDMVLRIYNRWGQVVFETRDATKGWDGTYNGDAAPMETYAYTLSVMFPNGQVFQKQGNITLLR
ncbi:MAG TPA: gliding motility-associated C-terminal domain-containing protein [Flavipsychrobacter sp.]